MFLRISVILAFGAAQAWLWGAPPADSTAAIVNSGSTNTPGFKIVVKRSGNAAYALLPRAHPQPQSQPAEAPAKRELPPALAHRLFLDLNSARPFSNLPRPRCMKSVSFGTRLTIQFRGDETPDLNCGAGQSAKLSALIEDAKQVVAVFGAH